MEYDLKFLKVAVKQAKKSVEGGGFPAGAIVVKDDKIISKGISIGFKLKDPTSHAETSSIRKACKKLKTTDLSGCILYASLEPCLMCFQVSNWANISKIIFTCKKTKEMVNKKYYEGDNDIRKINKKNSHKIKIEYMPNYEKEMLEMIKEWEK